MVGRRFMNAVGVYAATPLPYQDTRATPGTGVMGTAVSTVFDSG